MIQLDFGDHRPLYAQIKEKFKELIMRGVLHPGDKMPSVRDLANNLAINPNTIQRAYKELEDEGFIYSQRARGSFVSPLSELQTETQNKTLYDTLEKTLRELCFRGEDPAKILETVTQMMNKYQRGDEIDLRGKSDQTF